MVFERKKTGKNERNKKFSFLRKKKKQTQERGRKDSKERKKTKTENKKGETEHKKVQNLNDLHFINSCILIFIEGACIPKQSLSFLEPALSALSAL